ncbi:MAG TPA: hypothetical protein VMD27_02920 [Candidatus Aquilonibacter sp.]|nr:hypothetical protein [Candidatus Aquilonibacter sp.]
MKIAISLFAGLLTGLTIGWYVGHESSHTQKEITTHNYVSIRQYDIDVQKAEEEAENKAELLIALNWFSHERERGDKFFAEVIGTCYYNYAVKPTTNHDALFLRSEIEQLAKTNSLVRTELETDAKIINQGHE